MAKQMPGGKEHSVLFICLGNICRSPIAEAVFLKLLKDENKLDQWNVDSAALGDWHIGKGPDKRTLQTLKKFNITDYKHKARQVTPADFGEFEYIFGMDDQNMCDLDDVKPSKYTAKLQKLGEYDPEGELIIQDPYFGNDMADFDKVYEQCVRCCKAFLSAVSKG